MAKLSERRKKFVDRLFFNNFNQSEAYTYAYEIENNDNEYPKKAGSRLMTFDDVKGYYNHKLALYRKKLDIDKNKMIDKLMTINNLYDEMLFIANKDEITEEEEDRLFRLTQLLKGSDAAKAKDMIIRMIGAYEPDKLDVTQQIYTIDFNDFEADNEEEDDEGQD